ncbi:DUF3618 domain-containing protein [Actinoplanes sp. NPDC051859]|uniref:DUF3618 domain-containing protein n=1 Tax=Actinoplanes sp. NPDC051859 TaxID=3363909 RepID=UPI0037AAA714
MTRTSPQRRLRADIAQTRAELGVTVQQLAALTDVTTRATRAVADTAGRERHKLVAVKDPAVHAAAGTIADKAPFARRRLAASEAPAPIRRLLPLIALAAVAAATTTVTLAVLNP